MVVVAVVAGRSRLSPLLAVTHAEEHDVVACRIHQRLAVGGGWWVRVVGGQGWSVDEVVGEGEWSARVGGESGGASGSGVQRCASRAVVWSCYGRVYSAVLALAGVGVIGGGSSFGSNRRWRWRRWWQQRSAKACVSGLGGGSTSVLERTVSSAHCAFWVTSSLKPNT